MTPKNHKCVNSWNSAEKPDKPKAADKVPVAREPVEAATVETYTINRGPKGAEAIFIGRSEAGDRVVGNADLTDPATSAAFESGEPFGKAGAYAIQGRAAAFVAHLSGSYSGVMGLPVHETVQMLRAMTANL